MDSLSWVNANTVEGKRSSLDRSFGKIQTVEEVRIMEFLLVGMLYQVQQLVPTGIGFLQSALTDGLQCVLVGMTNFLVNMSVLIGQVTPRAELCPFLRETTPAAS